MPGAPLACSIGVEHAAIPILLADDDDDDWSLTRDALRESRIENPLRRVADGEELLDYLRRRGRFAAPADAPRPGIILLDLNMPRKGGHEALAEIKADPALRPIPVIVFSTSTADIDVVRTYQLGASSFIAKPRTFEGLVDAMKAIERYWLRTVNLPIRALEAT
jgi:CheY-like chemotaxis protein